MKVHSIFAGSADRERAKRYAGGSIIEQEQSREIEDGDEDGAIPKTKIETIVKVDSEAEARDERAYQEDVIREIA